MRIFTLLSFAAIFAAQSANAQNPVQNQRISLESVSGVYAPAQSPSVVFVVSVEDLLLSRAHDVRNRLLGYRALCWSVNT